jgi:hypothetical protein
MNEYTFEIVFSSGHSFEKSIKAYSYAEARQKIWLELDVDLKNDVESVDSVE